MTKPDSDTSLKQFLLLSASNSSANTALQILKNNKFDWVYLGEDVLNATSLGEIIKNNGRRIAIADNLKQTAEHLRQHYIDYIGDLSTKRKSLNWFAGRLSEKNPSVSKTFLHLCYVKICAEIIKMKNDRPVVFFIENTAVFETIVKKFPDTFCYVKMYETTYAPLLLAKDFLLYKVWFLLNNIYRIILAKYIYNRQKRIEGNEPITLIHTWLNKNSFDDTGGYHESYFGGLADQLRKNGRNIVIVPSILKPAPYHKILERISNSSEHFLVPHAVLSIFDILEVFFASFSNKPMREEFPLFDDLDISLLIYYDLTDDWIKGRVSSDLLFYHLVKKLKKKQIPIDSVIYTYENHAWEKILCIALRKYYPSTFLIGYQHSMISEMYLNYFISKNELDIAPLPDRVVTSSPRQHNLLLASGYPKEKLVLGGAIKYRSALLAPITEHKKGDLPIILVTPSTVDSGAELLLKILDAFNERKNYKILIKCHPITPFEMIKKRMGDVELPEHFVITNERLPELLKQCDTLIYTHSTTALEAIVANVPIIHVTSDHYLDFDPLWFSADVRFSAGTSEEIRKAVVTAITMNKQELAKKKMQWAETAKEILGEVKDETYKLFLR